MKSAKFLRKFGTLFWGLFELIEYGISHFAIVLVGFFTLTVQYAHALFCQNSLFQKNYHHFESAYRSVSPTLF